MERLDHLLKAGVGFAGLIFFMRMRKRLLDANGKSHKVLIKKSPQWAQNIASLILFFPLCLGICVELFRIFDPGFILSRRMGFIFSGGCLAGLMLLALGIKIYAMFSKKQVKE